MGYNDEITHEDIGRLNADERERVAGASNLFVALQMAETGDTSELEKQVYLESYVRNGCLHRFIRFTDKRLNYLVLSMKRKYADSEMTSKESLKIGDNKFGATVDRKAYEEHEIDDMMINFLYDFNNKFIELEGGTLVNVPSIQSFKGEDDTHSYNKLMSYITGSDGKIGMFEVCILKTMEHRKGTKRFMINGVSDKINLNDIDVVSYDDIDTPADVDGNKMMADDLIGQVDERYSGVDEGATTDVYQPTKQFTYIKDNLKSVLTKNQYERFNVLVDAIENGDVKIDDLFHDVTDNLILTKLGDVWFKGEPNNYKQSAVSSLLNGMRKRMKAAIKLQGYEDKEVIQSDYRRLQGHSADDNRLVSEYKIWDKWLVRDLDVDRFYEDVDVTFNNSDAFIPFDEWEKIERHEQTVSDVIKKYQITKKMVNNPHGTLKTYVIDLENGEPMYSGEEMAERENKHCRQLLDWIREGRITFSRDNTNDGVMKSDTPKLNDMAYDDYVRLMERDLVLLDDVKELEIVKKYMNRDYFNTDNRYILKSEEFIEYKDNQYIDKKNYDMSKHVDEIEVNMTKRIMMMSNVADKKRSAI